MWPVGCDAVWSAYRTPTADVEKASVSRCVGVVLENVERAEWDGDALVVDMRTLLPNALSARNADCAKKSRFCDRWLPYNSVRHDDWLLDRPGDIMRLSKLAWARTASILDEVLTWTWVERGVAHFSCREAAVPLTPATRRIVRRVCLAMIFNFPGLLCRPSGESHLVPYDREVRLYHDWRLRGDTTLEHYKVTLLTATTHFTRADELPSMAARQARQRLPVQMHGHSRLSPLVQVWGGNRPWRNSRRAFRLTLFRERIAHREGQRD